MFFCLSLPATIEYGLHINICWAWTWCRPHYHLVADAENSQRVSSSVKRSLPAWPDSRRDDRRRCAAAACVPHSWRRRTRAGTRRWSTCRHRPTRSWPSDWTRPAEYFGNRWTWWKNSTLSSHLARGSELHDRTGGDGNVARKSNQESGKRRKEETRTR